jgi:hypothetical protein
MEFDLATALMPFRFGFMQNAFLISIIVSVPTALLSCFLVLKGWALMGDAISHAILPGIVLAHLIGAPLILGAFTAGMFTAVATGFLAGNSRIKQDTVMGVVFSGMFGLGIVLFVAVDSGVHLDHILFGNMLGVSATELWQSGLIAGGVVLILVLKWKDWLLHSFDPAQAKAGQQLALRAFGADFADDCRDAHGSGADLGDCPFDRARGDCLSLGTPVFHHAVGLGAAVHGVHADWHLCQFLSGQRARAHDRSGADRTFHRGLSAPPDPEPPRQFACR